MLNRNTRAVPGLTLFFLCCAAAPARAAEPWANPRLTETRGLALWLDASVQREARSAAAQRPLENGTALSIWLDASGHGRHVLQRVAAAQPRYHETFATDKRRLAEVRFDGKDDCLAATGLGAELAEFTAFLVAMPRANPGFFRAFLATNALGQNDYVTGMNFDMGGAASETFSTFNPEGRGFGGAQDLMQAEHPFGTFHIVRLVGGAGPGEIRLAVDGKPQGTRPREPGPLAMDEVSVGARFFSNSQEPAANAGFLDGDIAEVLLYDRALNDAEVQQVEAYLNAKYAPLLNLPDAASVAAFLQSGELPEVQFLVPGFAVRRLPVDLSNVNDLHYGADGRLFVLNYDGRIHTLTDTDGDGLEDRAEVWWDEPRLVMPLGMVLTEQGIVVSQNGKVVRLSDSDGDGRGDREESVATDWDRGLIYGGGGVDALGIAIDRDGSVYFALGTSNFFDAYMRNAETGEAAYRLDSDRGTIQRVTPDFKTREIHCTGTRFPVALAFNRHGDLFCTDQEGATWLPNGNPLDELLHIQPGRHYGFPPRHPKHLPGVIDEPSVYDYGPQHQSTCGLTFNGSAEQSPNSPLATLRSPLFGPPGWADDAFVAGYSRGKLYRTKLVKTAAGYVAQSQIIACLRNLTVDTCVAPDGALVIATHSGGPDWGTGPGGPGTLYQATYGGGDEPQPVAAWAASPTEVRIAFDREIDPARLAGIGEAVSISYGPHVRAGDRYEVKKPPYAVVEQQSRDPARDLAVHSVLLTPDRRTIVLETAAHPAAAHYAVRLPWPEVGRTSQSARPVDSTVNSTPESDNNPVGPGSPPDGIVKQDDAIEVDYALTGVAAAWKSADEARELRAVLPHPDLAVSAEFTAGSAEHERLREALAQPGTLELSTQFNLTDMLRPAVQPGAQIDYEWPPEEVTVVFASDRPVTVDVPREAGVRVLPSDDGRTSTLRLAADANKDRWLPISIQMETGKDRLPELSVAWLTNEDPRPRALPLSRCLLPFAARGEASTPVVPAVAQELAGGHWERGRALFYSKTARCSQCHSVRGQGGRIGADLSNLVHRDYASVLRDVREPNYALNPDFIAYSAVLTDGRVLTGTVRGDGDRLIVGDTQGKETSVARGDVETLAPQSISVMPEGLLKDLSREQVRDLLTFLLVPAPTMPRDLPGAPPPRSRGEVDAVLAGAPARIDAARRLNMVLVAGPKDHGPGEHDYPAWQRAWTSLFGMAENVSMETAWEWPSSEQLESADVMLFFQRGSWNDERAGQIDAFLARGGGLVYIHWAVEAGEQAESFARRIGMASNGGRLKFRHGPLQLVFDRDTAHPVTRNLRRAEFLDESYWQMIGDAGRINTLGTGEEEGAPRPLFWTYKPEPGGRVFVSILGHYSWTFDDPLFRVLLLRGTAWAAGEEVDRFNELVTVGVDLRTE